MTRQLRFFIVLSIVMMLFISGTLSQVAAQTEVEACSPEAIASTFDIIQPVLDSLPALEIIDFNNVFELTETLNALSLEYWNNIFPTIPACTEAQTLAYQVGLVLDHSLIGVMLVHTVLDASEGGMMDVADALGETISTQFEIAKQQLAEIEAVMGVQSDSAVEAVATAEPEAGDADQEGTSDDGESTAAVVPQAGDWVGEGYWGFAQLAVTFTITEDGTITDFVIDATDQTFGIDCHFDAGEVALNPDGSMVINIATNESEGQVSELTGTFESETFLNGAASQFLVCNGTVMEWFPAEDGSFGFWSATPAGQN